ncbi:MAG: hypothetical protein AB1420_12365 [Bacillota bacterium]
MSRKTLNWALFTIMWYIIMLILIPPKHRPKLFPFGFWLGFVQAILLNRITMRTYKLWRLPGDILIGGIPLFAALSWFPPAIIFAYYFPLTYNWIWKAAYIFFFAAGTTIAQHIQKRIGMWENINWKTIYTFPLAIVTHFIMTVLIPVFNIDHLRNK